MIRWFGSILKNTHKMLQPFYAVIGALFALCERLLPQDDRLFIFGSMGGAYPGDSSWHLFRWYLAHRPGTSSIFVCSNNTVYKDLKTRGFTVHKRSDPRLWIAVNRAKALYFTHAFTDVTPSHYLISRRTRVVYLTHDIAPKRTRHAVVGEPVTESLEAKSRIERRLVTDYISTSPFITKCRAEALQVPEARFRITGLPRNDILVRNRDLAQKTDRFFVNEKAPSHVILYAPTWRSGREATSLLPFPDLSIQKLAKMLDDRNAILILRCHKNDLKYREVRSRLNELTRTSSRIVDGTHERFGDVNELLPEVDVLISDYSGLIHDFLLLDRPIILVPYDRERFEQANGFFYDYDEMAPGPIVHTKTEFLDALQEALDQPELHAQQRKRLRDLIFTYQDDLACQRVAQLIEKHTGI